MIIFLTILQATVKKLLFISKVAAVTFQKHIEAIRKIHAFICSKTDITKVSSMLLKIHLQKLNYIEVMGILLHFSS